MVRAVPSDEDDHAQEEKKHGEEDNEGEDQVWTGVSCLAGLESGGHKRVRRYSTPESD